MTQASNTCRREGCGRPRGRHSALCDAHHDESLARIGLGRGRPPNPCADLRYRCLKQVRAAEARAVTDVELVAGLHLWLANAGVRGAERCWVPCLDALPAGVVAGLRAYAAGAKPDLFHPLPPVGPAREAAERLARDVHGRLTRLLATWLPPSERREDV